MTIEFRFIVGFLLAGIVACSPKNLPENPEEMKVLHLMKKEIDLNASLVLFSEAITRESLERDWTRHHSEWKVEDGWLTGINRGNWPGMAILKKSFPGNVLVEFEARTVLPSSHDINVIK